MQKRVLLPILIVLLIVAGITLAMSLRSETAQPTATSEPSATATETSTPTTEPSPTPTTRSIRASDIPDAHDSYLFQATIPLAWEVESVTALNALNFYDPTAPGENNLEKSHIFVRQFVATDFLTLSTVTIHDRQEQTFNGRPAVRYDIEKKAGVADFPNQPSWRNTRHIVTDIRVSDTNPSTFYVIASRPDLDPTIYEAFLQSLVVDASVTASLVPPIEELTSRITKKPFGIYITPENSPVRPERFTGYHTGIDVEYDDVTGDVPVRAVTAGTVKLARTVDGYGGVVAIEHTLNGEATIAIYGHLDPAQLPAAGATVTAGQQIGILGDGGTTETDGERKHLHFALVRGSTINLAGYVQSEAELVAWHDPLPFFG